MTADLHGPRLLILDFGSQYTQLIARRVREIGVYCELYPFHVDPEIIKNFKPTGIILSGGPQSVNAEVPPKAPAIVFDLGCPILGICYGMQTMAAQLGGTVQFAKHHEYGHASVVVTEPNALTQGIEDRLDEQGRAELDVWMSHGDHVSTLPEGFKTIAQSDNAPIAAMADEARKYYGVQFHPEVTHTPQGERLLTQFITDICGCETLWTPKNIISDAVARIRAQVGNDQVLLGLSGGVDSAVAAALLHEAIGDQLICVFVDTGLLRLNEGEQVVATFANHFGIRLKHVKAQDLFYEALKGVHDPEEKRKRIGTLFIDVFEKEANTLEGVKWLAQGTIYPDVIESAGTGSGTSAVIKSHHNVGGLPEKMNLKLVEPLRELFKDEVRKLGLTLGLPAEMVYRHPFPGPGLAVRILGEIKPDYVTMLRQADAIFIEELRRADYYDRVSQAFAVFLPVKSVGVVGDARQYAYVIALRAVETVDFMTARWAQLPYTLLATVANRIMNEVRGISRVTYDISGKPPATIEWE